jgi:DnaJ-class molecular chaperone
MEDTAKIIDSKESTSPMPPQGLTGGMPPGMPPGMDPMAMMSAMMGGMGGGGGMPGMGGMPVQAQNNIEMTIDIDLKDIFNGTTKELEIERKVICEEPDAEEPSADIVEEPVETEDSSDSDKTESEESEEKNKYIIKSKKIKVEIKKGHCDDTITIKGAGHQLTENDIGDLIVTINVNEHEYYDRDGSDLVMKKDISLNDALCGFTFKINDINDNELIVKTDQIIDIDPLGLVGKGLPDLDEPDKYGDIVILFDIIFPETLTSETKLELRKLLPDSVSLDETGENVLTLEDVDYDSESESEEEMGGAARDAPPGCAPQ